MIGAGEGGCERASEGQLCTVGAGAGALGLRGTVCREMPRYRYTFLATTGLPSTLEVERAHPLCKAYLQHDRSRCVAAFGFGVRGSPTRVRPDLILPHIHVTTHIDFSPVSGRITPPRGSRTK